MIKTTLLKKAAVGVKQDSSLIQLLAISFSIHKLLLNDLMNILELNSQYLEKEESASALIMFEGVNIHMLQTGNRNIFIHIYSPNL